MGAAAVIAGIAFAAQAGADARGTYVPAFHLAPAKSRDVLRAYFQGALHLGRDGRFELAGIEVGGFWRVANGKLILVNRGFFRIPYPVPDDLLKARYPSSQLEGLVLHRGPQGSWVLPAFGRVPGPVLFWRAPHRSTRLLVEESSREGMGPAVMSAYATLAEEADDRFEDLLDLIGDPKVPADHRIWGTFFFNDLRNPASAKRLAQLLLDLDISGLNQTTSRRLVRVFSRNLAEIMTAEAVPVLLKAAEKWPLEPSRLARALGVAKHRPSVPRLLEWLSHENLYVRSEACEALAKIGAEEALPAIRRLQDDPEGGVRLSANAAVLVLSSDPRERERAVANLAKLIDRVAFRNRDILEALGGSGLRSAMRHLIVVLETGSYLDRETAAEQLGRLGFREAVPALIAAKTPPEGGPPAPRSADPIEREAEAAFEMPYARVQKAVVEALWAIQKRPLDKTRMRPSSPAFSWRGTAAPTSLPGRLIFASSPRGTTRS